MSSIKTGPWLLAVSTCVVLFGAAVAPPFVGGAIGVPLMEAFSWVCHQIPDRSFSVGGESLAVCHRCTGIFAGLVIGSALLLPLHVPNGVIDRHGRAVLFVTIALNAIDWGITLLGIWENTMVSRFSTGLLFGVAAGYLFAKALAAGNAHARTSTAPETGLALSTHPTT
ncbi:MAG: DUF2085 domain-containing protein [Rubricoccaceae bacterium]|nr:DUF2085 domain-containing protein [Rubricoccaceae bacterium]